MSAVDYGGRVASLRNSGAERLKTIECFRGIAALAVVLFHSEDTVAKAKYFGFDPLAGFFVFGANGVDFFFVLSGFIITFAHWADLGRAGQVGQYVTKRFTRVYPPLWAVAIPFIVVIYATQSDNAPPLLTDKIQAAISSIFLVPSPLLPLPVVVWTLRHEVLFYALFIGVLVRPRVGVALLGIWGGACLFFLIVSSPENYLSGFFFSPYNLEFLVGMLCAYSTKKCRLPLPKLALTLGIAVFIYAAIVADHFVSRKPHPTWLVANPNGELIALFSCASALLILGASRLDIEKKTISPRFFLVLGAASYSIYLVHYPVVSAACKVLKKISAYMPIDPILAFVLVAFVSLGAGIMFHMLIEKPFTKAIGRRLLAKHPIS